MSRPVFGKKNAQLQRPRVDRFMPPRESFADERRLGYWRCDPKHETVDIWDAKHRKRRNYRKYLDDVFGLKWISNSEVKGYEDGTVLQPWPCSPRRRGFLSSADSILDLPNYSYAAFPDLLDWSSKNMLVAALGHNYHLYSWKTQSVTGQGVTIFPIECCQFDSKGELLLTGTHLQAVELHDVSLCKKIAIKWCYCNGCKNCNITAVNWSPTGNSYVTGCSEGAVSACDPRENKMNISSRRLSRTPIYSVKISPNARYVAAFALYSSVVHILVWPSLQHHSDWDSSSWTVKTITWHPWRSAFLGIGVKTSSLKTIIGVWDTPSSRVRTDYLEIGDNYSVDSILFSHRTGELVISLWNSDSRVTFPETSAQLLVMSNPHTVVDQSGQDRYGLDRVKTMFFSPDGTKLATATADEDLIIWNFLPEDEKIKTSATKKFYSMPVYLDYCTFGDVLR